MGRNGGVALSRISLLSPLQLLSMEVHLLFSGFLED